MNIYSFTSFISSRFFSEGLDLKMDLQQRKNTWGDFSWYSKLHSCALFWDVPPNYLTNDMFQIKSLITHAFLLLSAPLSFFWKYFPLLYPTFWGLVKLCLLGLTTKAKDLNEAQQRQQCCQLNPTAFKLMLWLPSLWGDNMNAYSPPDSKASSLPALHADLIGGNCALEAENKE